jgi:8-oxo-dGTP pyrophosphatase MutT (NUDIX family)
VGREANPPPDALRDVLLDPVEAAAMQAPGGTDAAVLIAMFGHPEQPGLVFTERRADLRRHPGEISFPGGRQDDPGEDLIATALREAEGRSASTLATSR